MKKFGISLLIFLILLSLFSGVSAAETFYCEYVPKTETGSLFYVDVYCERAVTSAVIELSFDESAVEYRSVTSDAESSSRAANGKVSIALANKSAFSGKLCRVGFVALRACETSFGLHMAQACDGNMKLITGLSDHSIKIKLGKDDVAASSSASSKTTAGTEKSGGKASSEKTEGSSKSSIITDSDEINGSAAASPGVFDLRRSDPWNYILLGAGAVILLAAASFAGFYIGRKIAKKKTADADPDGTAPADEVAFSEDEGSVAPDGDDADDDPLSADSNDTGYIPIPDVPDE